MNNLIKNMMIEKKNVNTNFENKKKKNKGKTLIEFIYQIPP
jgi:hypothetical protein